MPDHAADVDRVKGGMESSAVVLKDRTDNTRRLDRKQRGAGPKAPAEGDTHPHAQ